MTSWAKNLGCLICQDVATGEAPVRLVANCGGDWLFCCGDQDHLGNSVGLNDFVPAHIGHLLAADRTLAQTLRLPINMSASRKEENTPWRLGHFADDTYKPQEGDIYGLSIDNVRNIITDEISREKIYYNRNSEDHVGFLRFDDTGLEAVPIWSHRAAAQVFVETHFPGDRIASFQLKESKGFFDELKEREVDFLIYDVLGAAWSRILLVQDARAVVEKLLGSNDS